jgi:ferric-dicitrate binding protein FerR (iron transport regulator)
MELVLAKHLAVSTFTGTTTPMQQQLIEQWLAEPAHQELYYRWLEEWEQANPQFLPDTGRAYQTFLAKTSTPLAQAKPLAPARPLRGWRWQVAATLALLLVAGTWWGWEAIWYQTYQTAYGQVRTVALPDQSTVVLNANSHLRVPRFGFGARTREVYLRGEAEFSVRHLPQHQRFLVHTPDGLVVEVLGTEFGVYARPRGTKVALHHGRVQLHAPAQPVVAMKPGEVATVDAKGGLHLQPQPVLKPAAKAWQEHTFGFDNTPLQDITYQIEEHFGVKVQVDLALAQRRLSGEFQASNADELLQAVAQVLGVRVHQAGDGVLLAE